MSEQKLKLCPFCGNTAGEMIVENGEQFGRCRPCGIDYMHADDWNRRAAPPLLTDEQMPPLPIPVSWYSGNFGAAYTGQQLKIYARAVEAAVRKQILGDA